MSPRAAFRVGAGIRFAPDPSGMLERVVDHARNDPTIHGIVLLGSRARADRPADEWSDTDLLLVVDDPDAFLADAGWPARLGAMAITFLEETGHGRRERRVLYVDGTDLDLVPISVDEIRRGPTELAGLEILRRGFRILHDRDGLLADLPAWVADHPVSDDWPPQVVAFENLVSDFWYHAVWTARKLRRGELWVALRCLDGYMKGRLLTILEWQARSRDGADADPWFDGRFLERWADAEAVAGLRGAFAHNDAADVARARRATMALFRHEAGDLAVRLELPYPGRADEVATQLVEELLG
jgi:aminoglycoside 6-adenylyltransferase